MVSPTTRLGLTLLAAAAALGILGDALLRETPLGLNALLWTAAFSAALVVVARVNGEPVPVWLPLGLVLFAALLVWRDSTWLALLDGAALLAVVAAALVRQRIARIALGDVTDYVQAAVVALASAVGAFLLVLIEDVKWPELARGPRREQATAIARGLAIAIPLLVVFGALFIAADAVFEDLLGGVAPDIADVWSHVALALALAWAAGGLLRQLVSRAEDGGAPEEPPARRTLGTTELTIVLGALDLLFLAFVLVQLRYFFGGNEIVQERTGLTYAEYAREGFFELVAVAALALGVLLVVDWLRGGNARGGRLLSALGLALVVLLFVVVASALQRMRLYQREFGLTELRVYVSAFIVWLSVLFVWLAATVLRGRRERFAFGALVSAVVGVVALNALNPDALIARTNIDRAASAKDIDISYLEGLSADAAPTLAAHLPRLARENLSASAGYEGVAQSLLDRWGSGDDWRTWNWGRSRARDAVRERAAELRDLAR